MANTSLIPPTLQNIRTQRWVVAISIVLFGVKVLAFVLTQSIAILTDALESTVNVVAGLFGLYSLRLAAKPKDENHPYGHGKVEFISAAIEGTMITIAGLIIIYEAIHNLFVRQIIKELDLGIILLIITCIVNYIVAVACIRTGMKNQSVALMASGRHLKSDVLSSIAIVIGLVLIQLTGYPWIDSAVALLFAVYIIYTGYGILRTSIAGIMDEADIPLLLSLTGLLNTHRRPEWVDIHNLRLIKHGSGLHFDFHLTVPYYFTVAQSHAQVEILDELIKEEFGLGTEMFIHTDGCIPASCSLCKMSDCPVRQYPFERQAPWNLKSLLENQRHSLKEDS